MQIDKKNFYIITLQNNQKSKFLALRCVKSCLKFDIFPKLWNGFYVDKNNIHLPKSLLEYQFANLLEIKNFGLSLTAIAAFKSHVSLWVHCLIINKPIVILEHDAIVVKKINNHKIQNSIQYLGNKHQFENQDFNDSGFYYGLHNSDNVLEHAYSFMRGAHAYSIDPTVSRKLISLVLLNGIKKPLDMTLEKDLFTFYQDGVYAYELEDTEKTIKYPTIISY